jgi:hypothetical protein
VLFRLALAHRAVTAFRAMSLRCSGVSFWSRAFPPFRPNATAFGSFSFFFVISRPNLISTGPQNQETA